MSTQMPTLPVDCDQVECRYEKELARTRTHSNTYETGLGAEQIVRPDCFLAITLSKN